MKVAVIGAGMTGVATAELLRRAGHAVTLIDRLRPGDPGQTSYGNAGILASASLIPVSTPGVLAKAPGRWLNRDGPLFLRLGYLPRLLPWLRPFLARATPEGVAETAAGLAPLISDTVEAHEALAKGTPAEGMIHRGPWVLLYPSRAAYEAEAAEFALKRQHGLTWEEWDRARLEEWDPALGPAYQFAAAMDGHGWLDGAGPYLAALTGHFEAEGGTFHRAEVRDIRPTEAGVEIEMAGGSLTADKAVLSAGVWSTRLAARLGHKAMLEAERGYHLTLAGPSHRPPSPYMLTDAKLGVTPLTGGLRVAGLAEFAGLDHPAREGPTEMIRRQIRRVFPGLTWESEKAWLGQRPSTPDSLPLVGPSPKARHIVFAFGAQHLGITMGPKLGQIAAGLVQDRPLNLDMAPYRVDRFD